MTKNMIAQLEKLQAIKDSLHYSHLPEEQARELLEILDHIEAENKSLNLELTTVRMITSNLLVESARAGLPGALTGLSAQHIDQMAAPLHEGTVMLQKMVQDLAVQLRHQIEAEHPPQ